MATKEMYLEKDGTSVRSTEEVPKANPLASKAHPHSYRDPSRRGALEGRKAHAGKKYGACPYDPSGTNHLSKSASKIAPAATARMKAWKEGFAMEAGFEWKPYVSKAKEMTSHLEKMK